MPILSVPFMYLSHLPHTFIVTNLPILFFPYPWPVFWTIGSQCNQPTKRLTICCHSSDHSDPCSVGQWLVSSPGEWCHIKGLIHCGLKCWQVEHLVVAVARSSVLRKEPRHHSLCLFHCCHFHKNSLSKLWDGWGNKRIDIQNESFWPPDYWKPPL